MSRLSFSGTDEPEPAPEVGVAMEDSHAIVVVGASGDLAKKKTYPALFKLFLNGLLPPSFKVWGYARSASDDQTFRDKMRTWLEKSAGGQTEKLDAFLAALVYFQGQYNSPGEPPSRRLLPPLPRPHSHAGRPATRIPAAFLTSSTHNAL